MRPTPKNPPHPGEILREEFLLPMEISQARFAEHVGMTAAQISNIVNGELGVTAATATKFAQAFGTSAEFWLHLQVMYDLAHVAKSKPIKLLRQAS